MCINQISYCNCAQIKVVYSFWFIFCPFEAGIFLAFVGGAAALFGFSKTVLSSRKQDQELYEKGCVETARLLDGGHRLATRALAWGTFYAFLGTGTFCYGLWKLSGARNVRLKFANRFGGSFLFASGWPKGFFICQIADGRISTENGLSFAAIIERCTANQPHGIRWTHRFYEIFVDVSPRNGSKGIEFRFMLCSVS